MLTHGGDRIGFRETYGREPLDFSVNVNPAGLPPSARQAAAKALSHGERYPDMRYRRLCRALGQHCGVPEGCVTPGNGAADLIWRIAALVRGKPALLTAPTFSEYEAALSAFGCRIRRFQLLRETGFSVTEDFLSRITADLGAVFLCNPNNPTGRTVERALLLRILERCRDCGVLLCVDECFNGFLEEPAAHSLRGQLERYGNLILIGALTKLYAMAGLRLGYALCFDPEMTEKLWAQGQSWPVSAMAEAAGTAALADSAYLERSLALLRLERGRMKRELEAVFRESPYPFELYGGEANYLFFHTEIPDFGSRLAERGILVRDCRTYPGLEEGDYRTAVRLPAENDRLLAAVRELI